MTTEDQPTRPTSHPPCTTLRRARAYEKALPNGGIRMIAAHLTVIDTGTAVRRAASRQLEQFDLSPASYSLLRALYFARESSLFEGQIVHEMGTSQPNITQILHRLENHGLVERIVSPANRRAKIVRLTEAGETKCAVAVSAMLELMCASMASLSDAELKQLFMLLARVRETAANLLVTAQPHLQPLRSTAPTT